MKMTGMLALAAVTLTLAGCKTGDRTTGQAINDHFTANRVKDALSDAPIFKYPNVEVNVFEGNAQLSGFVPTAEQRLEAAQIASRVKGVTQVVNNILIKPAATGPATIRDPLGNETGRVMMDTNAPPHKPLRVEPSGTTQNPNNPNNPVDRD
jgi:hypothetical protein